MFNVKKSQVINYSCRTKEQPIPNITVKGKHVDVVQSIMHLGHLMTNNTYDFNVSQWIGDFNRQALADFKYVKSYVRNVLFQKYCTSFHELL